MKVQNHVIRGISRRVKHDIYFHDDFDGCSSAAVLMHFLATHSEWRLGMLHPTSLRINKEWPKRKVREPFFLVDYPLHPHATFWFDHHESSLSLLRKNKKKMGNRMWRVDAKFKSCCSFILHILMKEFNFKPPTYFNALTRAADMVDSAAYSSAQDTIMLKKPEVQIDACIENYVWNKKVISWLVGALSKNSIDDVVQEPMFKKLLKKVEIKYARSLDFFKNHIQLKGCVAVVDISIVRGIGNLRFAPYYFYPFAKFNIAMKQSDGVFHITVGTNPWNPEHRVDISKITMRYGGGGHRVVGGANFKTHNEMKRAVEEIIQILNKY